MQSKQTNKNFLYKLMYSLFELRDFQRYFQIIIMQILRLLSNFGLNKHIFTFFDIKFIKN